LDTDQVRTVEFPAVMVAGDAEKLEILAPTHTVTWLCLLPPQPDPVRIYVVVLPGLTERLPDEPTEPTPLSIDAVVAFDIDQLKVVEFPDVMVVGDAEKLEILTPTHTVTWLCMLPLDPFAVRIYVVVLPGLTEIEPDVPTEPTPLSIDMEVAFNTDQLKVVELPAVMVVGDAEKLEIFGPTVTVTWLCLLPPAPFAVRV
jgi:hypothetical protein